MERRTLGFATAGVGAILLVIGAIGFFANLSDGDGDAAITETAPSDAGTTTTAPATTTTTLPSTTTTAPPETSSTSTSTTTQAPPEDPGDYIASHIAAQGTNDVAFLLARLHPDVIARYGGEDACSAYLSSIPNPPFTLREIGPPEPWEYATDGQSATYPDAIPVEIERDVGGQTVIQEIHLVYVGNELRWFTDCGDPV